MIDAHHHIWLQKDLPWLLGPERARIFGAYGPIKRDYTIDEYLEDIEGTGIKQSVYVQANWAPNWAADEAAWVQSVADEHGWPHAIVGFADFTTADVRPQLDRLARNPLMRGVRQQFHWHENPLYRFATRPDLADDKTVQRNIAHLASHGWTFDLQLFASQMEGGARLANACPDVTFILQHAGMPVDASKSGMAVWRDGMKKLAACPNVVCKLSAFGTFIHRNDPDFIANMVTETTKLFGVSRCMFGSNFPIEKIWTSYGEMFDSFQAASSKMSKADRKSIFNDTARRVYRL